MLRIALDCSSITDFQQSTAIRIAKKFRNLHIGTPWWQPGCCSTAPPFYQKSLIVGAVKLSTPCELEYITDQLSGSWLLYDAPPCVLRISHFICTFVVLLYLVISFAQYSKFVQQCVCSPVKWVTISQCKGDLARTTLMDKIPLKLWRWEELVLVDGKKFREICIQLPVHFFLIRNGSE